MKHRKFSFLILVFSLILVGLFQNCGQPSQLEFWGSWDLSSQDGLQDASLNILQRRCTECHGAGVMNGNVTDITNLNYLVYSRLVIPGEPEISPLFIQVSQGLMPFGKPPLSTAEVEVLRSWISGLKPDILDGGGAPPDLTPIEPKYSSLAQKIFQPRCISCHSNKNYKHNSYAEIMRIVQAGNADQSLLYQVVTTGSPSAGVMPREGGRLSQEQITAIRDWINAGAQNN